MPEFTSIEEITVGIPGTGRRTLLKALSELSDAHFPGNLRLCVMDATRIDAPAQLALLDELAADPSLELLFVLNKADKISAPRTAVARALNLLRERGFSKPRLWPVCAAAAKVFRLPVGAELQPKELAAQRDFYYRYGPGENSLPAFAFTGEPTRPLGSRELTPQQLHLALVNTGVPALEAELAARAAELREQGAEDNAAEAAIGRPDRESEIQDRKSEETPAVRGGSCPEGEPPAHSEEAPVIGHLSPGDHAAEAVTDSPPEADAHEPEAVEAETPLSEGDPVEERIDALLEYLEAPADASESVPEAVPETAAPAETIEPAEAVLDETAPAEPDLLALAEGADCAQLLDLARSVPQLEAPDEERERILAALHETYLARQTEELDAMTRGADNLELASLRALADRIAAGPYTVQARAPYLERLNRRLDELQADALTELCAGVEQADSRTLARIRESLERADCAEILKSEHFRRIDARQEALDLEALERITAGAEAMSEKELRAVAVTLEANNWNPKYVTRYRHKIELCREAVLFREVEGELTELDDMERREVLALRDRIAQKELPARFTAPALSRIDEKLFRLDMLRLLALNRDFDRLDFEGLDELRAGVAKGDYCERAKRHYLNTLLARENALIFENASARVELTRQLMARHKLRTGDFTLASAGAEYQARLEEFWGGTGLEQPRDIPVFLFDNGSQYAMTGTRFYYKVGRHLDYLPLENIDRFQVMRQHLSLYLQIVGKDNSYRLTEARINRSGSERTLEFLNECLACWPEPGPAGPLPVSLRVPAEDVQSYTAPVEPVALSPSLAWKLFREAYEAAGLREGNLIRLEDPVSMERLPKLRLSLGLPENAPVIWYKSASRLGPVKEGMALGSRGIYRKEGKEPVRAIALWEIYAIRPVGSRRAVVTSLKNETLNLEISDDLVPLIADYVRAIQLGDYLRRPEEQP